ncbi:hypothetical protein C1646_759225 [Rhizophagus diaphanus]|nr:hypothetical protein C1646_759225 [Rhizophagus diaphanus] [Rhizophagus sp. MUCL 43196]
MRVIFELGYDPTQIYSRGFIETYIENKEKDNEILKIILDRWIKESGNSSNNTTENNSINNTPRVNTQTSENSIRSNSPIPIMATRDQLREDIRTVMRTIIGIDPGQNLATAPANTINATLTNMINPIQRAAKIADLPIFYGGEQDANDWIRDFNNVYAMNGYVDDQAKKLRKARPYLRDEAADWLEGLQGLNNFDQAADNTSFAYQMKSKYASAVRQQQ